MLSSDTLRSVYDTIPLIYDCALDKSKWPRALEAMGGLMDAMAASVALIDPHAHSVQLPIEWCSDPDWPKWKKLLDEKYAVLMPFFPLLPRMEVDTVLNTAGMVAAMGIKDDVYEYPFFKEWAIPSGRLDSVASVVYRSGPKIGLLNIHTPTTRDLTGPRELEIVSLLVPHVRRAVAIGDVLGTALTTAATLQATLDTLSTSVFVTDAGGKIVHSNDSGVAMLRAGKTITSLQGQLAAREPVASNALLGAIRQSDQLETIGAQGISVPLRSDSAPPSLAHVLPLTRSSMPQDLGNRAAAAVFVAPVEHALPPADAVMALYGFTRMETRVLMSIASGKKRIEAASELGISDNTAKTHLERIFAKTGVDDQAALTKLVASLASPARTLK